MPLCGIKLTQRFSLVSSPEEREFNMCEKKYYFCSKIIPHCGINLHVFKGRKKGKKSEFRRVDEKERCNVIRLSEVYEVLIATIPRYCNGILMRTNYPERR
jgi:hypothetical protein